MGCCFHKVPPNQINTAISVDSKSSIINDVDMDIITYDDPYCKHNANKNCQYLVELVDVLQYHRKWLKSQSMGSIKAESLSLYISSLNNYNVKGLLVLIKIYHHLQTKHHAELEEIYNYLCNNGFSCDLNDCKSTRRNYRDRQTNNMNNIEESRLQLYGRLSDSYQVIIQQMLDQIHCYFYHTFDIGFKFNQKEKQEIGDNNLNYDHDEFKTTINSSDNYKIQTTFKNMINIISKKKEKCRNIRGYSRFQNDSKFMSRVISHIAAADDKEHKEECTYGEEKTELVYSFGVKFYYEKQYCNNLNYDLTHNIGYKYNDWYINKKYSNLKDELLNNNISTISNKQLRDLLVKAKYYVKSNVIREYTNNIRTNNLIVMMTYCNFDKFQNEYTKTYRFLTISETCDQIKQRHVEFAHFGDTLQQTVEFNGIRIENSKIKKFYHGINMEMLFTSTLNRFNGPTSTSSAIEVALTFADGFGLLLELNDGTLLSCNKDNKYFDCELLSDYGNEAEKFFMAGRNPLKIVSIIDISLGENYKYFIKLITVLLSVIKGDISINNSKKYLNQKNEKGVIKLLKHELKENVFAEMPRYISNLLHHICINIKYIEIRYNATFGLNVITKEYRKYKILRKYLCCSNAEFFKLNKITLLFPNLLSISIESSNLTENVFNNILEYFEEKKKNGCINLALNNIIFRLPTKQWMSFKNIKKEYLHKFKRYNWIITRQKSNKIINISKQRKNNDDHRNSIGLAKAINSSTQTERFVLTESIDMFANN